MLKRKWTTKVKYLTPFETPIVKYFSDQSKPLKGIRVLDMSRILVGPYCTMYLADFGADVIKVESLEGDETRKWGPPFKGPDSTYYLSINRNKKSIAVDVKKPEGRDIIYKLAGISDIFIENFAHGVTDRLKVDYESLKKINPKLVYASITGYGPTGPYSEKPGFDNIIQSTSGLVHITGSEEQPYKVGVAICDVLTGLNITTGILAALYSRNLTGVGQKIETNLLHSTAEALVNVASTYLNGGKEAKRWGNHHPNIVPYGIYPVGQKKFITIACGTDKQYYELCKAIGRPDLATDSRYLLNKDRVGHREELNAILESEFQKYTLEDLVKLLEERRIPCGPINSLETLFSDKHVVETQMVEKVKSQYHGDLQFVRNPLKFGTSESETNPSQPPPTLGEHTREILVDLLKKTPEEVQELYDKKVVK